MTTKSFTTESPSFTETFYEGSEIGLFVTDGNQDRLFNGKLLYRNVRSKAIRDSKGSLKWEHSPQIFLTSDHPIKVYAYYPYNGEQRSLDPTSIPVSISPIATRTPSYKYGRLSKGQKNVTRKSPFAKLSMNHALALLSFLLYLDSNTHGRFQLTSIQLGNRAGGNTLRYSGTMDITTGNITGTPGSCNATLRTVNPSSTLRHADAEEQDIRIIPTCSPIQAKEVEALFTINGKTYKYVIPEGTCWKKGYRYSYHLYFNGEEIKLHKMVPRIWDSKLNNE